MIEIKKIKIFPQCIYLQPESTMLYNIKTYNDCRECCNYDKCSKYKESQDKQCNASGDNISLKQQQLLKRLAWISQNSIYGSLASLESRQRYEHGIPPQVKYVQEKLRDMGFCNELSEPDDMLQKPGPATVRKLPLSSMYGFMGLKRFGDSEPEFDGDVFIKNTPDLYSSSILNSEFDGDPVFCRIGGLPSTPVTLSDFEGDILATIPIYDGGYTFVSDIGRCYAALLFMDDESCKRAMGFPEKGFTIHEASKFIYEFEVNISSHDREILTPAAITSMMNRLRDLVRSSLR